MNFKTSNRTNFVNITKAVSNWRATSACSSKHNNVTSVSCSGLPRTRFSVINFVLFTSQSTSHFVVKNFLENLKLTHQSAWFRWTLTKDVNFDFPRTNFIDFSKTIVHRRTSNDHSPNKVIVTSLPSSRLPGAFVSVNFNQKFTSFFFVFRFHFVVENNIKIILELKNRAWFQNLRQETQNWQ